MLRMNALRHAIIVDVMQLCYDGYYGSGFHGASRRLNQLLLGVRRERTHLAAIEES